MYSQSYNAQSPGITNNPFLNDPSSTHTRFPDISSISDSPPNVQYTSQWPSLDDNGIAKFTKSTNDPPEKCAYNTVPARVFANGGIGVGAPPQSGQPFQPSSGFGQQLVAQVNATGYGQTPVQPQSQAYPTQYQNSYQTGYPAQQQPQMQYNTGYPAQQQQQYNGIQPGYSQQQMQPPSYQEVAQFDPFGPIAQGWGETQPPNQSQISPSSTLPATYNGHVHPREFIRSHKAELETWDSYAWKQVLNSFDALKDAWAARKTEVEGRISQVQRDYGYTGQQEVARLQGVLKEADSNFGKMSWYLFDPPELMRGGRRVGCGLFIPNARGIPRISAIR